jgi:hypothetical protein
MIHPLHTLGCAIRRISPEPGTSGGARLVTGLTVAAALIALGGLAVAVGAATTGDPAYVVVGALEVVCGGLLFVYSRRMAETERRLAALDQPEDT